MASIKKSVMFSDATVQYIEARTKQENEISWSQELNEAFKSLKFISSQALPDLTGKEWEYILNVYAGCEMSLNLPLRIASDMMDDVGAISLDELSEDYASLVKKVHGMSQIEQYAIHDFVKKYWCGDWSDYKDFKQIVDKIKSL